jgi:hypothetical protein
VVPAWDRSYNLQTGYLFRVICSRILYFILYYYSTDFLFWISLAYHVIAFRRFFSNVHKNIILCTYKYYIALKTPVLIFGSSLGKKIKS